MYVGSVLRPGVEERPTLSDLDEFKDRYRRSVEAFIKGDPGPQKELWSRRADVTLANPLGPPAKGLERVFKAMESAAAPIREGGDLTFDVISSYETADLAYEVAIQRGRSRFGDAAEMVPVALRVTTIFRREEVGWTLVHRHADRITEQQPPESLGQASGARRSDAAL